MADEAICYVVRDVTGETQLSVRFVLRSHARTFAEQCAMPVRVWKLVRKRRPLEMAERSSLTSGPVPVSS